MNFQGDSYPIINCLCEGEILAVMPKSGGASKSTIFYKVMATYPNGSQGILQNVTTGTMFGGIGDNFQFRLRGTNDDSSNAPTDKQFLSDGSRKATLGDRVLISFLGGHISRPVIVGFLPHPSANYIYESHADLTPQGTMTYLGVTFQWDDMGQFSVVRRGAPDLNYVPGGLGTALADVAALGSLSGTDPTLPPSSAALKPQPDDEVVRMAFLSGGVFRLTDSAGQMIEMDHNKNRIYISNNDLKSTEAGDSQGPQIATNSTDAEYVLWDSDKQMILINTRSLLELYSFDARKDTTEGDYSSKVKGDTTWTLEGDLTEKVDGSHTYTVDGDFSGKVTGDYTQDATGDMTFSTTGALSVKATGDVEISGGAGTSKLTLSNGKVALKGATAEVLDLFDQLLTALQSATFPSPVGPTGPAINLPDFVKIQVLLAGIKM